MDSEKTKQIIIAYNAINDAIGAIKAQITIELKDSESVSKMTRSYKRALNSIEDVCGSLQDCLDEMEDDINSLEGTIYEDGEIENSNNLIADILFDNIPPKIKKIPNQPAMDAMADEIEKSESVKMAEDIFLRRIA